MLNRILLLMLCCLAANSYSQSGSDKEDWALLLDKELSQWDTYLSYRHQLGYNGDVPTDESGNPISPIGFNPEDGEGVFTVIEDNDSPMMRISGEVYGAVISKAEYDNYHLRLEVKWGDKKWVPRESLLRDTGILYHSVGKHGIEHFRTWMLSQEFQVMEGHMGDYWKQGTSAIDIRAYQGEYIMSPVADERAGWLEAGTGSEANNIYVMRSANYESPMGEWTQLDLICFEDKSLHIVNGEVVMILQNSRYDDSDGTSIPLTKGKIQIQSEAAEVYYRNIRIKPLNALPSQYVALFE